MGRPLSPGALQVTASVLSVARTLRYRHRRPWSSVGGGGGSFNLSQVCIILLHIFGSAYLKMPLPRPGAAGQEGRAPVIKY